MDRFYHISPYDFNEFIIPYGGLHFGSLDSALQVGVRKKTNTLYVYECNIDLEHLKIEEVFDVGNADEWEKERKYSDAHVFSYKNKYEQGVSPSIAIFNDIVLDHVHIINKRIISKDDAFKELLSIIQQNFSHKR